MKTPVNDAWQKMSFKNTPVYIHPESPLWVVSRALGDRMFSGLESHIGFNKSTFKTGLFLNIPWGGSEVFLWTRDKFNKNKIDFFMLPVLRDIDTWDDLMHFMNKDEQLLGITPHTFDALKELGLLPGQRINTAQEDS